MVPSVFKTKIYVFRLFITKFVITKSTKVPVTLTIILPNKIIYKYSY